MTGCSPRPFSAANPNTIPALRLTATFNANFMSGSLFASAEPAGVDVEGLLPFLLLFFIMLRCTLVNCKDETTVAKKSEETVSSDVYGTEYVTELRWYVTVLCT